MLKSMLDLLEKTYFVFLSIFYINLFAANSVEKAEFIRVNMV